MTDGDQDARTKPRYVLIGGVIVAAIALAAVWFMWSGANGKHYLVSPSGEARIEISETCMEVGCSRLAILDQSGMRSSCPLALPGNTPLFGTVQARWAEDESSVELAYESAEGDEGLVAIVLADCTLSE